MPTTVQVHKPRTSQFDTYPVFDLLINQDLKTSSLKFRSTDPNAPIPGSLVAVFSAANLAFIVESVTTDFNGVVEVNCISAWEFLKRRNWQSYSKRDKFKPRSDGQTYYNFFRWMNTVPNQRMGFNWASSLPYTDLNDVDVDPATSVYDLVCDMIASRNLALVSTIVPYASNYGVTEVDLALLDLDRDTSFVPIDGMDYVKSSFTRRLPENPTHWTIIDTLDSGNYKVSSRGNIRTWRQNHAYMFDSGDYKGAYRYETAIQGDSKKQWGPLTIGIRPGELKTSTVEVDKLNSGDFGNLTIGRPVSFSALGMFVTGYVISRTISGGQITNYSVKVQPDHFYKDGRDITGEWM